MVNPPHPPKGVIMDKEKQILQYMEKLQISREGAEQLWNDDQEDFIGDNGEEMTKKAKEIKRYEKSADTPKERAPREKKIDVEKVAILQILQKALIDNGYNVTVVNEQKEISFDSFLVTLTKHRPPKKGA